MRLAYQETSAVPHPTGEFCHFQVLSRWLRQAGHSGGQKRKPIFATRLSHIPTRPGALTSFSKYPSLSRWFKIHAKKKKSDIYWFLRPPNRNIFLGFVWFGIFCSFVLFHLVLLSFLFSGLFSIKPIICFVGRKFPIWRQHSVEIEGADRPPPNVSPTLGIRQMSLSLNLRGYLSCCFPNPACYTHSDAAWKGKALPDTLPRFTVRN